MKNIGQIQKIGIAVIVIIVVIAGVAAVVYMRGGEEPNGQVENDQQWYGGDELVVWEWGSYEWENYWRDFKEQHPDVTVNHKLFGSTDEAMSKLAAGGRFDVVHLGTCSKLFLSRYYAQDALAPIKTEWIPRYENLYDYFKTNFIEDEDFMWNGEPYTMPEEWGPTSLLYHKEMFEEEGLEPPESWSALWDQKYTETVGVAMFDSPSEMAGLIMLGLGYTPEQIRNPTDNMLDEFEDTVQKCFERSDAIYTGSYDAFQLISKEEVGIAATWGSGYAYATKADVPAGYVGFTEGTGFREGESYETWVTGMSVGKRTMYNGRYKLAHDFINAWLSDEKGRGGVAQVNRFYYASTNKAAVESPHADQDVIELMRLDEADKFLEEGIGWNELLPNVSIWDEYTDRWIRAKTKAGV